MVCTAAGLLGLGIWTRQRRQANTFMAMSALKSPKRPAEKRTEDSAEDLNLEARGMSKVGCSTAHCFYSKSLCLGSAWLHVMPGHACTFTSIRWS